LNGNNSSGDTPQFSKSRFAILEKLHKLRNWIKLLFLPDVAKRLPELSNEIIKYLKQNNFKMNAEFSDKVTIMYDYYFLPNYIFRVTIISDVYVEENHLSFQIDTVLDDEISPIAVRYRIKSFDEFIFLITQTLRSPKFQI